MEPTEVLARLAEFGTPPDAASALKISVGLDETIARFRDETLPFIAGGGAELQFACAPYGRGKTHFLRTLQQVARLKGFPTAYVDCRSDQAPFASLQETYRIIAGNMLPAGSTKDLARKSGPEAVIEEAITSVSPERAQERIVAVQRDGYLASDFRNLVVAYCRMTRQDQRNRVMEEADASGLRALEDELRALLRSDLSTRIRIPDLYRAHTWLPRPLGRLGRRNAASWLRSLGSLPRSLGYPGLVILFDETEQTHSLHKLGVRQRRVHLANLRNFVDHMALGNFRGCAIYYAVVDEFLEIARSELGALSQRIERIHLGGKDRVRNPRAVWVDLDELTQPSPESVAFYDELGQRIASIGLEAGVSKSAAFELARTLRTQSASFSTSINVGAVREFVKIAANLVAQELSRHV